MNYRILDLSKKDEWKNYLNQLPPDQQDIYYTPEYYALYENYGDGKAQCFVLEHDGEIALYPYLINSINTLGYRLDDDYYDIQGAYGYNGVVASSYFSRFIKNFYQEFESYCQLNNIVAEFTRFNPLLNNHIFSRNILEIIPNRKTVYVDLNNKTEEIFKSFQATTRKQIRRACNKYNLQLEIINFPNKNDIAGLYKIYYTSMSRVKADKYLYFNESFFSELTDLENSVTFFAKYNNIIISFIIMILGKRYAHGFLGGTIAEYMKYYPFSFLYWKIIKYCSDNNFFKLHFGGGNTADPDDSLLSFKKNFSSSMADFYIGKKIHNTDIYYKIIDQWQNRYTVNEDNDIFLRYREIIE